MSNTGHLLERYREHPAVVQLSKAIQQPHARVHLAGLMGAQCAFVLASTVLGAASAVVYIAESKEEAAYLLNDLQGILPAEAVHFFPDSFKRPAVFDVLNPTQTLQRSEVVSRLGAPPAPPMEGGRRALAAPSGNGPDGSEEKLDPLGTGADTATPGGPEAPVLPPSMGGPGGAIIVTYPEALFEKVVSPEVLAQSRIEIAREEKLDVDFVIQVLVEYGFERTDFVYEPGQFSIRGGIVDLFSFGNELPYRIELFDDEVESIRTFDPLTQLSKQSISRVRIVPNLNTRFRQDQKVSLFRVLPENTVIWIRDFQFLLDRLQYCFEKAEQYAGKITALDAAELRELFRDRAFVYPTDVVNDVRGHALVFLEKPGPAVETLLDVSAAP